MSPKKIWGIIIIVLGIIFILNGISGYGFIAFTEESLTSQNIMIKKMYGKSFTKSMGIDRDLERIKNLKIGSILLFLIGIGGTIIGSLMIKGNKPKQFYVPDEDIGRLTRKNGKWKI